MTELERYKLAYKIMCLSHGEVDSDDCYNVSAAVIRGEPINWNTYAEDTIVKLRPLFGDTK